MNAQQNIVFFKNKHFSEQIELVGEGDFNMNVVKEVLATDSFLNMDIESRGCQNGEAFTTCATGNFIDSLISNCQCLPFHLRMSNEVNP